MTIEEQLRELVLQMDRVGTNMTYIGDAETAEHGKELINAATMVKSWADAIKEIEP